MGLIYVDVELFNSIDLDNASKGLIGEDEIKRFPLNIMVDTGSIMLAINENIREALQLKIFKKERYTIANNEVGLFDVAGPVQVRFNNKACNCDVVVLPGNSEPLLGAVPLELMDLIVYPNKNLLMTPGYQ